jgi:hypothetical protein
MLRRITEYGGLDARKLMDIYSESNEENTEYFFPEETDKAKAVRQVEEGFLDFLKNEFFHHHDRKKHLEIFAFAKQLLSPPR